jgi:hypothetical protein
MKMINNEERIKATPENKYKEIFGVEKRVFDRMLKILNITKTYNNDSNMGRPVKLSVLDCLMITLMYWREYRTFRHIAYDYGISKSSVGRAIHWVEDTLINSGVFNLKSKRELKENLSKIEIAVIDVTEQEIERPQKKQEDWYSGKKRNTP